MHLRAAPAGRDWRRDVEVTVGDYALQTFPRRLQSNRAQSELVKQLGDRPGALAPYRLTLGTIAVHAGALRRRGRVTPAAFAARGGARLPRRRE